MLFAVNYSYPFTGAASKIVPPLPSDFFRPKLWNINGIIDPFGKLFISPSGGFYGASIQPGDPLMICSATPPLKQTFTVQNLLTDDGLVLVEQPDNYYNDCLFKLGIGTLHTFPSLATIISQRGVHSYTFKFGTLWTGAPVLAFARSPAGDIYCID